MSCLISLRGLRETVLAGHGSTTATVRTLDDVSLDLHNGDLMLLSGSAVVGARALILAIERLHARVAGDRHAAPGVRIRRGAIVVGAAEAIAAAWAVHSPRDIGVRRDRFRSGAADHTSRTVYLLRVRPGAVSTPAPWRTWAAAFRDGGGAIMLWNVPPAAFNSINQRSRFPGPPGATDESSSVALHVPIGSPLRSRVAEGATRLRPNAGIHPAGRVRYFTLAAGRLRQERAMASTSPRASSSADSDDSPSRPYGAHLPTMLLPP